MSCCQPPLSISTLEEDTIWAPNRKTPYELLIGNNLNVSYFRVFESKCYVLLKRPKSSKFAPKVYEGFMLCCDSNSHVYRVETTCDAVFDETNGSQVEQYDLDDIDDEEAPCDALRTMLLVMWDHKMSMKINLLQMKLLLLPKKMIKIKKMNKMKTMIKIKRWAMIKRKLNKMNMSMIKKSQDHHHLLIQDLDKPFNVIIRSTTFLVP
jgi:hypothetical protein